MTMWNDYEKIARRLDRIANAFERIANALETANIIEADRKTEPQTEEERCREVVRGFMNIVDDMRNLTEEEMESVNKYIESISKPTGVNVFDLMDEPQTYITEDRDTQILDAWQVKLQTERSE